MNVLKKYKKSAVLALLSNNLSHREIHKKTGVNRRTIRLIAGSSASTPLATDPAVGQLQTAPPRPPTAGSKIPAWARSACEPYRDWIEAQIRIGRNAMSIYQDLVDLHGFKQKYNSVKRFCRGLRKSEPVQFDRLEFLPGEEAQVDYGEGAPTLSPVTGKYKKPRLFVMTLKYSRRSFRKVIWKSSKEEWARLHEEGFLYFGGVPQYIVLDNLREGVTKPDLYEPQINSLYVALLSHYGSVADPARVRDPDRKGTVENAIQHTQGTALKGKRFDTIEAQNLFLLHWEETWACTRIHGRTKRQVEEMFKEEKPHLKPCPAEKFQFYKEESRMVQDDGTVAIDSVNYAARPAKIGSIVRVRIFDHEIEILHAETLSTLRRHARSLRKGEFILPEDERIYNPSRQTHGILKEAEVIGPSVRMICEKLLENEGRSGHRKMRGIVALSKVHPNYRIEATCKRGLDLGVMSYQTIKRMVDDQAQKEIMVKDKNSPVVTQSHALIREQQEYFDFWNSHKSVGDEASGELIPLLH